MSECACWQRLGKSTAYRDLKIVPNAPETQNFHFLIINRDTHEN